MIPKLKLALLCAVSFVLLGCSQSNKEFDEVLKRFDEMVSIYEKYSTKTPFCMQDVADINGQVMTQLNDLGGRLSKIKESGPKPSDEQIQRYVQVSNRMSKAMIALGANMKNMQMCENFVSLLQQPAVAAPAAPAATPAAAETAKADTPAPAPTPAAAPAPAPAAAPAPAPAPAVAAATPPEPVKPSFDCTKASNKVEKMICGSPDLARLDVQLVDAYRKANANSADPAKLKSEQIAWIKQSRACADEACVAQAYRARIAELSK